MRLLTQSPEPLVRGALKQTPLAEFLVQAYDGAFEGTLLLQTPEREKSAILFVRGAPAKARPFNDQVFLGDVAVDLGLIERPVSVSTRKRAEAAGRPHLEILREEGHLDETGLYVALREQLKRQVLLLCDLPETTGFGFYRTNYLAEWGPPGEWRIKPLPLLWRALCDHLPQARRTAWLERLGDRPLKVRPEAPVSRYALQKPEASVLDMIRALPAGLSKLRESGVGTPELVERVVCALLLSRQLDVGSDKEPVGYREPPETPNSVAPAGTGAARRGITAPRPAAIPSDFLGAVESSRGRSATSRRPAAPAGSASSAALRADIEAYQARDPKNFYDILGVPRTADASTVRGAFFQLARNWHPDRLPADLADLKPIVTRAFAAMGEAHQTLSDDKRRAEYDALLDNTPDDEQAQVTAILDAAHAFQMAEVLMKKKDFAEALVKAKVAYEGDPTQADYAALYGWLQGMNRTKDFGDLIALLDNALKVNGDNVRALWYRGQLLKKAGHTLRAVKDFKKIVELKPNHTEAQRELRVYTMRKRSGGGSQPTGFLGKFLKKD